jgi:hypothetical protein
MTPLTLKLGARWSWGFTVTRRCEVEDWRILEDRKYLSIYPSGFITAVAVFQRPNAIPPCFSIKGIYIFISIYIFVRIFLAVRYSLH